jgi:photosystem II stability/assembly factor-like uncharacterized protein
LAYSAPTTYLSGIACMGATRCIAVGGTSALTERPLLLVSADRGHQWMQKALPAQVGDLNTVACASAATCVAAGFSAGGASAAIGEPTLLRTTDGGTEWTPEAVPPGLTSITTVSCRTNSLCVVGGSGPGPTASSRSVAATSTNGGRTWTAPSVVNQSAGFGDIACIDPQTCVGSLYSGATTTAGQGRAVVTTDGGAVWSVLNTAVGGAESCSQTMCLSVGGSPHTTTRQHPVWFVMAFVTTDRGQSWAKVRVPAYQGIPYGASCDASDVCVVVGGGTDSALGTRPAVIMTYGH